eukprot:CAMPEP_0171922076 /NCGR_PEP_ID=MMETSP0993-20121228/20787_1 /TAXON_ID=483369 /ORGANISM="non described non described, Strain CCMP2098" /LENGTH=141 /DNA_ID=CAMNT_0012559633 /DNA_START=245 /DNA_END=667 /DNA_ORIENTATION=-
MSVASMVWMTLSSAGNMRRIEAKVPYAWSFTTLSCLSTQLTMGRRWWWARLFPTLISFDMGPDACRPDALLIELILIDPLLIDPENLPDILDVLLAPSAGACLQLWCTLRAGSWDTLSEPTSDMASSNPGSKLVEELPPIN